MKLSLSLYVILFLSTFAVLTLIIQYTLFEKSLHNDNIELRALSVAFLLILLRRRGIGMDTLNHAIQKLSNDDNMHVTTTFYERLCELIYWINSTNTDANEMIMDDNLKVSVFVCCYV
jgi:hypothetical protein